MMRTKKLSRRAGFVLIEALIALLLVSVGLLAISKLQVLSIAGAGEAKARSRAMTLSQQKLEQLRNILLLTDFNAGPLVSGTSNVAPQGDDTATYTMTWTVSLTAPEQQLLQIRTTWTDRFNQPQQLDLNSLIAWDDPGARVKSTTGGPLPQLISPTGDAVRGIGGYGNTTPPGTVTTNSDGTRIHVRGDGVTELLASNGKILLFIPSKNGVAQPFVTISGKIFFDQNAPNNSLPSSANVRVRLSSEGECIFNNAPNAMIADSGGSNSYKYFLYTCYIGAGWYGNVGVVVDDSVSGGAGNPTICVGDPAFNAGVSDSTLISAHPVEAATRSYRGFKGSPGAYFSTGMQSGTHYGTTPSPATAPFAGAPKPSLYPAFYGTPSTAANYFEQNFLLTGLSGSASCASKMTGGLFTKNAGQYFCIAPDNDIAADKCPVIWPNFTVGSGGSINFTLTVTPAGNGSGTVTSAPAGISCGPTCSGSFATGTPVTLTAAPASGSTFAGWSGACTGTGTCMVTLNAATAVTASFSGSTTDTLTVTRAGSGTGTVDSTPVGIACGSTCSFTFSPSNSSVMLTATPTGGSTFTGWGGACSGTGTCTVSVSGAVGVTATFTAPVTYAVNVTKAGAGTGTVTGSPGSINCGATCSASFAASTAVTLTATSTAGSTFTGWSGACTGGGTCVITVPTAASAVTATFALNATCTTTISGSAHDKNGTVSASSGGTCSMLGGVSYSCPSLSTPSGTQIVLTNQRTTGQTYLYTLNVTACGTQTNVNFPP